MKTTHLFLRVLIIVGFLLPYNNIIWSQSKDKSEDKTLSPYFVVIGDNNDVDALPLKSTNVNTTIVGSIADVTVRQVYVNSGKSPIEAIYTFPMSTKAAVYGMQMTIGKRIVRAQIEEKQKARKDYEKAKSEGKRASLLEQSRPNVFTMNVSNIMVGDTIMVELNYTELLVPEKGVYSFVYPTVVGPRYASKNEKNIDDFVSTPYTHEGVAPTYTFDYALSINSGVPIQDVTCGTHKMKVLMSGLNKAVLHLDPSESSAGNRDVVVKYSMQGNAIESGVLLYEGRDENFFLTMVQPPHKVAKADIPPREYVFIVDVSGSMWGFPMEITKKLMQNLIVNLKPTDKFNVVLFSSSSAVFSPQSVDATQENMTNALNFIKGGHSWSGTEVLDALRTAYALPQADEDMARTFVIVTDGYVSVEKECFEMIRKNNDKANFFAFGIGSSVNRYLIEGMAFAGNGEPMIVVNEKEATAQAERFRSYINTPVLTHIKFKTKGFDTYDVEPMTVPDMMSERPIMIFGKYKGTPSGNITLSGKVGRKPYKQTFDLSKATADSSNSALRYLWARERIKYLDYQVENSEDNAAKKILELGLKYNLMTNYTSFVAIDEEIVNKDGRQVSVKQAVPLPEGVSDYAVGYDAGAVSHRSASMKGNWVTLAEEEEVSVEEEIFMVVETEPEFPGGMDSLMAFLARNIVYPQEAKEKGIQGKVFVSFCVEKDGSISNIKVLRDIGGGCGAEAVRVVKMMPKWIPGKQRGKAVRVQYNLPLQFILDE